MEPRVDALQGALNIQGQEVLTAYAPIQPLRWLMFVELPEQEAYASLYAALQRLAVVLLAASIFAVLAGIFLARRMVGPIQALRAGAERMGGGDFSQHISIKTGDELEGLANQFNDMGERLQESYADLENKVEQRTAELSETLQQQTATSEVLGVISSSPGDLEPVFQTMLENATRVCHAKYGQLFLYEADKNAFHAVATTDVASEWSDYLASHPFIPADPMVPLGRVAATRAIVHVADVTQEQGYLQGFPGLVAVVELGGARTLLVVPMLKENQLIGALGLYRQEVLQFTDKQIELVANFAKQAVIAIENARLLKELRQRTDDLSESLEQQTATSEVLQVISSSAGELEPVFNKMLENATRICGAKFGTMTLYEDGGFRTVALYNAPQAYVDTQLYKVIRPRPDSGLGLLEKTRKAVHIDDLRTQPPYIEGNPHVRALADLAGARTLVLVPMLRESELVGSITIFRQEVKPFTDKQTELVSNFANQAVIAIENTRLLKELHQRTDDLTESLEQQTATSEVLQVISSSQGELDPVFQTMLESATRVCGANFGIMNLWDGEKFNIAADHNIPPAFATYRQETGLQPHPDTALAKVVQTHQAIQILDIRESPAYLAGVPMVVRIADIADARTLIVVPMLKEDDLMGTITIFRQEVKPFTDKQVALVENFTKQAVIAIENTRLLNALKDRTEELSRSLDDLRTAQDRLVQTEKLASLGQLTAGIAHEIKNPLNFVNNFSALSGELIDEMNDVLKDVKIDDKTREEIDELTHMLKGNLEKVVQHGKRADSIVKNMLLHSREGSGEHRPADINAIVEESLNLAYHGARAEKNGFNITLKRNLDPDAGAVDLYPQEITRVFLNLISNGFYAATKRKESSNGDFEPTLSATTRSLGNRVEIRIRDNGTGIPLEVKEKMFNPFFTTKPAGEGTGLGLSMSHDIVVKQHGGKIDVATEPGVFTEFIITLPRTLAAQGNTGGTH
jgi:signal transduction histidine kinase